MTAAALIQYVIFEKPRDYPDHFVVRRFHIANGEIQAELHCELATSLDEARSHVPRGMCRIGRLENDDPQVVEVWT